ncbi:MAG: Crp/Fnr family transcriptional regulator, partial [Vicinamibacteria bacterium]
LEESMAMEFGDSHEIPSAPEPAGPVKPVEPVKPVKNEEPSAVPASTEDSGGFELVEEPEVETPGFTQEPMAFTGSASAGEAEDEEAIEVVTIEEDEPAAAVDLSFDGVEAPVAVFEQEEIVLDADEPAIETSEEEPEIEIVEIDLESEPALAADGAESLIGALGEDIDSLIDSIIDDVGSSARGAAPSREAAPTHIPLFSDLTTSEFIAVAILLSRRVAKVGEVIVREGDPGESMFIVSTGEVRATIARDGRELPVATMRDGDFFGEMAVLSGEPRTATVTAVKSTELLELSREHLSEICSRHPHVEAKIRLAFDERVSRSVPKG